MTTSSYYTCDFKNGLWGRALSTGQSPFCFPFKVKRDAGDKVDNDSF